MVTQVQPAKTRFATPFPSAPKSRIAAPMDVTHVLLVSFLWLLEFEFPKTDSTLIISGQRDSYGRHFSVSRSPLQPLQSLRRQSHHPALRQNYPCHAGQVLPNQPS